MEMIQGLPGSAGFAEGKIVRIKKNLAANNDVDFTNAVAELLQLRLALQLAEGDLNALLHKARTANDKEACEILEAHLQLLADPEVESQTKDLIQNSKTPAGTAYAQVISQFKALLEASGDDYMKARIADLDDISDRVLFYIHSPKGKYGELQITEPSIIVAEDLTPSQLLSWDKRLIKALILEKGGVASHVAILARSMEIPAVVGVGKDIAILNTEDEVYVDALAGNIMQNPTAEELSVLRHKRQGFEEKAESLRKFRDKESLLADGTKLLLAANIAGPQDMDAVLKNGAEGVGLYRTEFLFLDRNSPPSEEEQFTVYREVFSKSNHQHKIIVRTLDAGGDKELHYLGLPTEENPFLGLRAIRVCLQNIDLFKTQLRALLRAADGANWGIMFPMVSQLEEITTTRRILDEVLADLKAANIPHSKNFDFGVMVEVPTMAFMMDLIAPHVDFVSFGTNDLLQYSTASDRLSPDLQQIYNPYNPGFLRLLHHAISTARLNNIHVGICGSLAHHEGLAPFLVGCGAQELSMSAQHVLPLREKISKWTMASLRGLVAAALQAKTCDEAKSALSIG